MSLDLLPDPAELVAALAGKAEDAFESRSGEWFDDLLVEGRKFADTELDDPEFKDGASAALDVLEDGKQPFLRLSEYALAQVVGCFGTDKEEEARNIYISTQATYAERRKWMQDGGDMVQRDREERDVAWAAVQAVLLKVGAIGLQILTKLLMSRLGL